MTKAEMITHGLANPNARFAIPEGISTGCAVNRKGQIVIACAGRPLSTFDEPDEAYDSDPDFAHVLAPE